MFRHQILYQFRHARLQIYAILNELYLLNEPYFKILWLRNRDYVVFDALVEWLSHQFINLMLDQIEYLFAWGLWQRYDVAVEFDNLFYRFAKFSDDVHQSFCDQKFHFNDDFTQIRFALWNKVPGVNQHLESFNVLLILNHNLRKVVDVVVQLFHKLILYLYR